MVSDAPIVLYRPESPVEPHLLRIARSVAGVCGSRKVLLIAESDQMSSLEEQWGQMPFERVPAAECKPEEVGAGVLVLYPDSEELNVELVAELGGRADAVIVTDTDRELATDPARPGRLTFAEFRSAGFDRAGGSVLWAGLVYRSGAVGGARDTMLAVVGPPDTPLSRHLAAAPRTLLCDPHIADLPLAELAAAPPAKVCIATNNITGMNRNGVGTAHASLAAFLASKGHEVTILFTGKHLELAEMEKWTGYYRERGVEFIPLPEFPLAEFFDNLLASHRAYQWLVERDRTAPFDVIHFTECQGSGFHTLCAKRAGLGFEKTTMVVTPHGSLRWCVEGNFGRLSMLREFMTDEIEFRSLELADIVIGPSAYMLDWLVSRGAHLPPRTAVQQYLMPVEIAESWNGASAVNEWVFFGRLERRKGLHFFLDALDILHDELPEDFVVTFLGEHVPWNAAQTTPEYIAERAKKWTCRWQIIDTLNQIEACDYVRGEGRLSIIASVQDNLPNTVIECLALGIKFIASRTGGIQELIAPDDLARITFGIEDGKVGLVDALRRSLRDGYGDRPKFAVDPEETARCIDLWHRAAALRPPAAPERPPVGRKRLRVVAAPASVEEAESLAASLREQSHSDYFVELFVGDEERASIGEAMQSAVDSRFSVLPIEEDAGLAKAIGDRLESDGADATLVLGRGLTLRPDALAILAREPGKVISFGVEAAEEDEVSLVPIGGWALLHCYGNVSTAGFLVTRAAAGDIGLPYGKDITEVVDDFVVRAALVGFLSADNPELLARGPGYREFYEDLPWAPLPWIVAKAVAFLPPDMRIYGDWIAGLSEAVEDIRGHADRVMAHAERVQAHADRIEEGRDEARRKIEKLNGRIDDYKKRLEDRRLQIERLKANGGRGIEVGRFVKRLGLSIKKRIKQ